MKYIRTKDGKIFDLSEICIPYQVIESWIDFNSQGRFEIVKQANTIEELCDEFVGIDSQGHYIIHNNEFIKGARIVPLEKVNYRGAIWTEWGLKYVAKMNEKGELELIYELCS